MKSAPHTKLKHNASFTLAQYISIIIYLLSPFICFYCLEFYTHDPWLMHYSPQLINYFLLLAAELLIYALTGLSWLSASLIAVYALIAGIANYFVMSFRNNPILPWDLKSIQTALTVSDNYSYEFDNRFIISTIVLILVIVCSLVFRMKWKAGFFPKRLCASLISLAAVLIISFGMMNTAVTDFFLTPTNLFTQWASYRDNGFTVSFLQNMQYLNIEKPKGYDAQQLENQLETFLAEYEANGNLNNSNHDSNSDNPNVSSDAQLPSENTNETPHVIVIMNESFSDLSVLHGFETNEDYMPFIHSLQQQDSDNLITGNLFVSVCGGNTANTEFEFLTGNSMAFLPPGSVAYQQYIQGELPSLASQFADNEYTTYGLHPYGSSGWNRINVYPWLGLNNNFFRNNFYDTRIIRKYVSDESAYEKIVDLFEKRDLNEKQFFFEVTMQNHGGYSQIYEDFPIQVTLNDIKTYSSSATENYLTLIQESDRVFKELISYYETVDEPVLILMFGDHQPNDYVSENIASLTGNDKENRSLEEAQNRYIVPYVIWANYALDKDSAGLADLSTAQANAVSELINDNTMSCNYLGACIARLTGLETSSYQDFLLILKKTLPVITANVVINNEGKYMTVEEAKEAYPELMSLYEKIQYYILFEN